MWTMFGSSMIVPMLSSVPIEHDVDHLEQDNIFLSVKLVTTNLLIIGSKCRPKRDRTAIRLVETNPYRCTSQRSLRGWGAMVASLIRDTMKG